jgi:hypothetical protein
VTGHKLSRAVGRFSAEVKFSLYYHCVQTNSGILPAFNYAVIRGSFVGNKRQE